MISGMGVTLREASTSGGTERFSGGSYEKSLVYVISSIYQRPSCLISTTLYVAFFQAGGAGMAFMHGAQDGQKFMGVFLLGIFLVNGQTATEFSVPMWLMVLCSVVMALGTSIGGYRIIKSVGMDMVKLQPYQGFAADAGATLCLLLSSLTGIPVSTTHTKTTAIMGVGASRRLSAVNWKIVGEMALAWVLTFPGCGLLGFVMAKLFMWIF